MTIQANAFAVYAIRFASRDASLRKEHFYRGDPCGDESLPIDYFVWVIVGRGTTVLVDAGFTREVAERRGNRTFLQPPAETMRQLGIATDSVKNIILTHLHYDHTGHLPDFPSAQVHLQRTELDYWTGPYARRGENPHLIEPGDLAYVKEQLKNGKVTLVDGDAEIVPGVEVHRVGGHTQGLQVVAVATEGGTLVLASDATHFYANIDEDRPYSIVDHLPSMYDAFDWIKMTASVPEFIIPGHDPLVLERFPAVPGLEGVAVRLA
ncbi:N-acyl homoserine lactonase family protein [Arthrobacter methylotrophus]|uniref:N-acyl homoserine lactonase family protein n=1 Tax=Arthrobacter methylotrophus TaxID=121291 RepID=A0ABV5UMS4_9MICC